MAACNASGGIVWRHGGMAALSGGIGGIVAALLAAWRHCWRHCGGIGGIADLQLPRSPLVSVLPLWAGDEGCTICSRAWCRKDAQGKVIGCCKLILGNSSTKHYGGMAGGMAGGIVGGIVAALWRHWRHG